METRLIEGKSADFWPILAQIVAQVAPLMCLPGLRDADYYSRSFSQSSFEDRSFAVVMDGKPVAALIASLGITAEGNTEISFFGIPAIYLESNALSPADRRRLSDVMGRKLDAFAGADVGQFRMVAVGCPTLLTELLARGADTSLSFWQLLDLAQSEEDLRAGVRKSYKNLINRGFAEAEIRTLGKECQWEDLDVFRQLHAEVAGRQTRSEESWRMQLEKIRAGEAFLVLATRESRSVAGAYLIHDGRVCYYGSAAALGKEEAYGCAHGVVWTAVRYARSLGCGHFDLGQILFPGQHCLIDIHARPVLDESHRFANERELGISRFKKGFGGVSQPRIDIIWKPKKSSNSTTSV